MLVSGTLGYIVRGSYAGFAVGLIYGVNWTTNKLMLQ